MGYEPYRMLTLRIETWDEFYRLAASFLADKRQWVFRGHASAEWELKTLLERENDKLKGTHNGDGLSLSSGQYSPPCAPSSEDEQIEAFKALTLWDHYMGEHKLPYLAAMQHYEIPTRLLDFTYSIFVAVHFAFNGKKASGDTAVWAVCLDPVWEYARKILCIPHEAGNYEFEKRILEIGDELIGHAESQYTSARYGILPVVNIGDNPRLRAQNGLFLMPFTLDGFLFNLERSLPPGLVSWPYGKDKPSSDIRYLSFDEYDELRNKQDVVTLKVICSRQMKKQADAVFQQSNLTTARLFPDKSFEAIRARVKSRFGHK